MSSFFDNNLIFKGSLLYSFDKTKELDIIQNAPLSIKIDDNSSLSKISNFTSKLFFEQFRSLIYSEDLEFGYYSKTCDFVEKNIKENKELVLNSFLENTLKNSNDKYILFAILHTISHLDYELVFPHAQFIPLSLINHKDLEIRDYSIQCFEIWESKESLTYLKNLNLESHSLQNYLNNVISYIESL